MTETKKDITGVLEYSKKINDTQSIAETSAGSVTNTSTESNSTAETSPNFLDETSGQGASDVSFDIPGIQSEPQPSGNPDFETLTENLTAALHEESKTFHETLSEVQALAPDKLLDKIKNYSEELPFGRPVVQPQVPFNLSIAGQLNSTEKEKLLHLLVRHSIGISEEELKIQFEQDRILLPRISEYAGILLVQALRGSNAVFRLFPTDAPLEENESNQLDRAEPGSIEISEHPAEMLPLTQGATLSQITNPVTFDTLMATATLKTQTVEASHSAEYQEILEALKRELKYKAYRKGARGIIGFAVSLTPLSSPTHYRLTASGTAVK